MKNAEIERLLIAMRSEIPELLSERGFGLDTCILSTRIATHVLAEYRVPYRILGVQLLAFNEEARRHIDEGRTPLATPEAHTVGIGFGSEGKGYDGHLVFVVKGRWLVDLTLDQVSRPAKGIIARPEVWRREDTVKPARYRLIEGFAEYGFHEDQSYRERSSDWRIRPRDPLVLEARRRVLAIFPGMR